MNLKSSDKLYRLRSPNFEKLTNASDKIKINTIMTPQDMSENIKIYAQTFGSTPSCTLVTKLQDSEYAKKIIHYCLMFPASFGETIY